MNRITLNCGSSTLLVCASLVLTACSRENQHPSVPVTESTSEPVANETPPAPGEPRSAPLAVRPPSAQQPTAVVIPTDDPAATLNALTQAVRKFSFEQRRVPASLEELAKAGYVQAVPTPPAGKKFAIDKKRMTVELANP